MSDEKPVEKIGPSGLSAAQIHKLIQETGLKPRPLFTDREVVRRVIDSLVEQGKLRVVEEVEYSRVAIHMVGPHAYRCGGCGKSYRIAGNRIDGSDEYYEWGFCPGCGNKIRR